MTQFMSGLVRGLFAAAVLAGAAPASEDLFERSVRPLLTSKCGACHNPKTKVGGFDLTTPDGLRAADREAGLLRTGRLMRAVRWEGKMKMPPAGRLTTGELSALDGWISAGAALPAAAKTEAGGGATPAADWSRRAQYWSFQPVRKPALPQVRDAARVRNDIDSYVFAKLDAAGLAVPPDADKLVLLRRATFDLHGLPPAPEEIREFLADETPSAYPRLIERLLASPRYGERWGRHWLDVARFAESSGIDENQAYREAWRYREYVIDSFNRDVPFNRFMLEQVAGDIAGAMEADPVRGRIATGFLALGPKAIVEQDKTKQLYDAIDEQIDTTTKAFLGLTVSCARCHDHKFDPITTEDYYGLASIFRSTRIYETLEGRSSSLYQAPLSSPEIYAVYKQRQEEVARKQLEIAALLEPEVTDYVYREVHPKLASYMVAAWRVDRQKADVAEVARQEGLDAKAVEKLAKYLSDDGSFRPALAKWHAATADTVHAVASEYASMIAEPAARWKAIVKKWAQSVRNDLAGGRKPAPQIRYEGFAFTRESDRFFGDISFLAKTFNERDRQDGAFAIPEADRVRYVSEPIRQRVEQLEKELAELKKTSPEKPPMTHAVSEGDRFDQRIFIRGNSANHGPVVAKRFPAALTGGNQPAVTTPSGRLELGQWLGSASNPLPARVAVNRIWQWHFGEGLVRTPDNFGLRGESPTHPELLDYLAARFIEGGWSVKDLHRAIMNSSTYRFSSETNGPAWENDPANRLWSRFARRRMSAEEIRDSWLAVNGKLDLRTGSYLDAVAGSRTDSRRERTRMDEHFRRTVYLPVDRNSLAAMMVLFDFPDSTTSTGKRGETYIAPQALYLMNNDFFRQQALTFARRLLAAPDLSSAARVEQGILRAWGRLASPPETEQLIAFLDGYPKRKDEDGVPASWLALGRLLLESNHFFYID